MKQENEDFRIGQPLAIGILLGIAIARLVNYSKEHVKEEFDLVINLKKELEKAVSEENYEKAAELRDLIKEMTNDTI